MNTNLHERSFTVVLMNAEENPLAVIDDETFKKGNWHWIKTPSSWKPGEPLPAAAANLDAIIVFAVKYQEKETEELCRSLRQDSTLEAIPLLVAVDQYQMPLANRVREIPNTDFVLVPIEEPSLAKHLKQASESRGG
jgi:CheY-like chemotaxis protein